MKISSSISFRFGQPRDLVAIIKMKRFVSSLKQRLDELVVSVHLFAALLIAGAGHLQYTNTAVHGTVTVRLTHMQRP